MKKIILCTTILFSIINANDRTNFDPTKLRDRVQKHYEELQEKGIDLRRSADKLLRRRFPKQTESAAALGSEAEKGEVVIDKEVETVETSEQPFVFTRKKTSNQPPVLAHEKASLQPPVLSHMDLDSEVLWSQARENLLDVGISVVAGLFASWVSYNAFSTARSSHKEHKTRSASLHGGFGFFFVAFVAMLAKTAWDDSAKFQENYAQLKNLQGMSIIGD